MIFTCVHPRKKRSACPGIENSFWFGVQEIARALVTNGLPFKRLYRAREFIRKEKIAFEIPAGHELMQRLE
jgi:predicted RNA polymerase sigma factor